MSGILALILSALLLALAVCVFRAKWSSRVIRGIVSTVSFVLFGLSGVYLFANHFTGAGITQSVIYHLRYGLEGAGFGEYLGVLAGVLLFSILGLAVTAWIFRLLSTRRKSRFALKTFALALLLTAVVVNPVNRNLLALYAVAESDAEPNPAEFAEFYRLPEIKGGAHKNLVYLYLESLERTYLDESLFPGLAPNLQALEREAYSFIDVRQVHGTGWTIGGMVASQCGLPLFLPPDEEDDAGQEDFLPGALCMGDILASAGYRLDYMGGASLEFGGKGSFYQSHGFMKVEGREELLAALEDPDYLSGWGLYDDSLLGLAGERFRELSRGGQPFGLFLLTLDTHRNGHVSNYCKDLQYAEGEDPILNAVHCTDRLVGGFIDRIRQSPAAGDTLIVVASDHLAMRNSVWDELRQEERRNLLLVIDPAGTQGVEDASPASTLDAAPTILSLMGLETEALGFGRNLLSEQATLVETRQDIDAFLDRQKGFIMPMWASPPAGRKGEGKQGNPSLP